jgi:DNA-binding NarL/FixJ family response regulator
MPNMNGILLIEKILAEDSRARIIAISGVSSEQLERAKSLGASRTLQKPYEATELLEAVTEILSRAGESPSVDDLWV